MAKKHDISLEIGDAAIAELRRLEQMSSARAMATDCVSGGNQAATCSRSKETESSSRGLRDELVKKLEASRSELGARMKFAAKSRRYRRGAPNHRGSRERGLGVGGLQCRPHVARQLAVRASATSYLCQL